jgi:hypothetical protein
VNSFFFPCTATSCQFSAWISRMTIPSLSRPHPIAMLRSGAWTLVTVTDPYLHMTTGVVLAKYFFNSLMYYSVPEICLSVYLYLLTVLWAFSLYQRRITSSQRVKMARLSSGTLITLSTFSRWRYTNSVAVFYRGQFLYSTHLLCVREYECE